MSINPVVLDLSHYQNVISFPRVYAAGIRGIINKATEGTLSVDRTFDIRRAPVNSAGLLYGAYHFLRPGGPVASQVEHFLSVAKPDDNMLLALDHEDPLVTLDAAKEFIRLVALRVGRSPIIYGGNVLKVQLGNRIDPDLAKVRLWLSHYSATPSWPKTWDRPWLWQFTGDGKGPQPHSVDGVSGTGIDINSYTGLNLAGEWSGGKVATVAPAAPTAAPVAQPRPIPPPVDKPSVAPPKGLWDRLRNLFGF